MISRTCLPFAWLCSCRSVDSAPAACDPSADATPDAIPASTASSPVVGVRLAPAHLELEAAIDPQGRSLRPDQVAHWLAEALGCPLSLDGVRRSELRLRSC